MAKIINTDFKLAQLPLQPGSTEQPLRSVTASLGYQQSGWLLKMLPSSFEIRSKPAFVVSEKDGAWFSTTGKKLLLVKLEPGELNAPGTRIEAAFIDPMAKRLYVQVEGYPVSEPRGPFPLPKDFTLSRIAGSQGEAPVRDTIERGGGRADPPMLFKATLSAPVATVASPGDNVAAQALPAIRDYLAKGIQNDFDNYDPKLGDDSPTVVLKGSLGEILDKSGRKGSKKYNAVRDAAVAAARALPASAFDEVESFPSGWFLSANYPILSGHPDYFEVYLYKDKSVRSIEIEID